MAAFTSYRIRQPFDFAGRKGKIAFDATVSPMSPLLGWISLAITDEPISIPGYSIATNDEGSLIPRNAVEVHFTSVPEDSGIAVRHVHVFENHVDTIHAPPPTSTPASFEAGKLNHFEVDVSEGGIEVRFTPYSEDGKKFSPAAFVWKLDTPLPLSRGYVQLSVHNHATLLYTQPGGIGLPSTDAPIARIDNVGFDGPVIDTFREYEIPDALVKFNDGEFPAGHPDPHNPEGVGYDIGYILHDAQVGPTKKLRFRDVDTSGVTRARLSFSARIIPFPEGFDPENYTFRARLNGQGWRDRKLTAEEAAFFTEGPTTVDDSGLPVGDSETQGRLALTLDVPLEDLVGGENTLEFVTAHVPTTYPPLVCNIDLVLGTE